MREVFYTIWSVIGAAILIGVVMASMPSWKDSSRLRTVDNDISGWVRCDSTSVAPGVAGNCPESR